MTTETPIVFLPGFLCDERLWTHQLKAFMPLAPCTVVDLRHKTSVQGMVEAIQALPYPHFHLVGFSMGGYIAQAFAVQSPERLRTLVLIGSSGAVLSEKEYTGRKRMKSLLQNVAYAGLSDLELKYYLHPKAYASEEIRETVRAMAASNTSEMYLGQMNATLDRVDFKSQLQLLKVPITMVSGIQDKLAPREQVQAFHQALPHSHLHLLDECGHFVPLEKPSELNRILNEIF